MNLLSYRKLSDAILASHEFPLKALSCDFDKSKVCRIAVTRANCLINRSAGAVLNYLFSVNPKDNFKKGKIPFCSASNKKIGAAVDLSESSVGRYLRLLAEHGFILFNDHPAGKRFYNKNTGQKYGMCLVPSCELSSEFEQENLKLHSASIAYSSQKSSIKTKKQTLRRGFERVLPIARAYEDPSFAQEFENLQTDFEKIANAPMEPAHKSEALSMLYHMFVRLNRQFEHLHSTQIYDFEPENSHDLTHEQIEAEAIYRKLQQQFSDADRQQCRAEHEQKLSISSRRVAVAVSPHTDLPAPANPSPAVPADLQTCAVNFAEACPQNCGGDQEFKHSLTVIYKKSINWQKTPFYEPNLSMKGRVSKLDLSAQHTTAKRLLKLEGKTSEDDSETDFIDLELLRASLRCVADALQIDFSSWRQFIDHIGLMKTYVLFSDDGLREALQDHSARFLALCLAITMEKSLRDPAAIRNTGAYCRRLTRFKSEGPLERELWKLAQSDLNKGQRPYVEL